VDIVGVGRFTAHLHFPILGFFLYQLEVGC